MFGQIIVSVPYDNHAATAHQRLPVIFAEQNSRIAVNVAPVQVNDPKRVIWIRTNCRCKFLDIFGLQSLVAAVNYRAAQHVVRLLQILVYLCLFKLHCCLPRRFSGNGNMPPDAVLCRWQ